MPPKSTPVQVVCGICADTFLVKPSYASKAKYCSRKCLGAAKTRQAVADRPSKSCHVCGIQFSASPSLLKRQKFCSVECAGKAKRRVDKPGIDLVCTICGGKYKSKRRTSRFCSSRCYGDSQQGIRRPTKGWFIDAAKRYRYIYSPSHPKAIFGSRYVAEHRLVAEHTIGRMLEDNEIVHHIDGDGLNNSPDNLQVMDQREHIALHRSRGDLRRW